MPDWLASRLSFLGLAVVVLQQIPGIVWAIHPPPVDPFAENSGSLIVELLEKTFGIATILLLVVVLAKKPLLPGAATAFGAGAFMLLGVYYALYIAYYLGVTRLPVLLGMAALPPLCFLFTALSQGNLPALITSLIFGAVHIGLTYTNFASPR